MSVSRIQLHLKLTTLFYTIAVYTYLKQGWANGGPRKHSGKIFKCEISFEVNLNRDLLFFHRLVSIYIRTVVPKVGDTAPLGTVRNSRWAVKLKWAIGWR